LKQFVFCQKRKATGLFTKKRKEEIDEQINEFVTKKPPFMKRIKKERLRWRQKSSPSSITIPPYRRISC